MNKNNINVFYHLKYSNAFLLNDAATNINETYDNFQYKLKQKEYKNININVCSCMFHLALLQVTYKF